MVRPYVRTEEVPREVTEPMKRLFGTIANAMERLRVPEQGVPWSEFRRALSGQPVRPEHADVINDAWRGWCRQWLRGVADGQREARPRDFTFDLELEP